jgi:hypothetical protein
MARTPTAPPSGVELSRLLTIRGREAAHAWITKTLGVPLKLNYVRAAASRREIPGCREVAGALMFSTQGLFDWVTSLSERTAS